MSTSEELRTRLWSLPKARVFVGARPKLWTGSCIVLRRAKDRHGINIDCRYLEREPPPGPGCDDCGLPYDDDGWADLVVPHDVWTEISPTGDEGGLLCPTCMVRAAQRAGIKATALFRSGPFAVEATDV